MADPHGPGPSGGPPADWYPDPWRQAPYRWWDGRGWTSYTSLPPAAAAGPSPAARVAPPAPPLPAAHVAPAAYPVRLVERPVAAAAQPIDPARRRRMIAEVVIVLGVFPFPYVVNAIAGLLESVVGHGDSGRIPLPIHAHPGLSLLVDVLLVLEPLVAAALAAYLLTTSGEGGLPAIGLDARWPRTDAALLLPVFLLCFFAPLLGGEIVLRLVHIQGVAPSAQHLPWYFVLVNVLSSVQAGVVEEIVVLGYLVRRLEQLDVPTGWLLVIAVGVRISYHVYYGWGVLPFIIWALVSVLVYRRYRRLWPFVIVHALWDLGLSLVPFAGGAPLVIEVAILLPSTFVFWLVWRDRLPAPPAPRQRALSRTRAG